MADSAASMGQLRSRIEQRQAALDEREVFRKKISDEIRRRMDKDEEVRQKGQKREKRRQTSAEAAASKKRKTTALKFASVALVLAAAVVLLTTSMTTVRFVARDAVCFAKATAGLVGTDASELAPPGGDTTTTTTGRVFSDAHNRSLFWGTYRPHLLAGVRSREEKALLFGLAWYDEQGVFPVRHTAEDGDEVLFRWEAHDGRWYGREVIVDRQNDLHVTVRFVKSADGRGWRMQVDGRRGGRSMHPVRVVLYFATELTQAPGSEQTKTLLTLSPLAEERSKVPAAGLGTGAFSVQHGVRVNGPLQSAVTGHRFSATVLDDAPFATAGSQWEAHGWDPQPDQWRLDLRNGGRRLQNHRLYMKPAPRLGSVSLRKRVTDGFSFSVALREADVNPYVADEVFSAHPGLSDYCAFSSVAAARERNFEKRFDTLFGLHDKIAALVEERGGDMPSPSTLVGLARSSISGVLGGVGYWHGDYRVHQKPTKKESVSGKAPPAYKTMPAATLFSGVPSRAKFPRGFLWDEGFHQLLVGRWDAELSKDVILHWIDGNVVDRSSGWIPREQILGAEPRTRVPDEFVAQHPTHTNPPSMLLSVETFAREAAKRHAVASDDYFLARAQPAVQRWLGYLRQSQCGGSADCATKPLTTPNASLLFRWRSRNRYHLLASGLDDYPRPHCRPAWKELHLDLFCWASMMAKTVNKISPTGDVASSAPSAEEWQSSLDAIFYDPTRKRYSDVTGCSDDPASAKRYSPFFGYVNLFPVLTTVLEDRDKAAQLIRMARDELSGGFGLQSLSNASRKLLKEHDDYWTGPIWLNLNYLMLRALHTKYIALVGLEAEALYAELRHDLIRNVGREFARTGKVWENYDLSNGRGRGTAPFTGWSALIVAILTEQY